MVSCLVEPPLLRELSGKSILLTCTVVCYFKAVLSAQVSVQQRQVSAIARQHLFALFAGALISAILSTVDSTLLVASGLLSHNLLVPLLRQPTERQRVLVARLGVGAFGILAYVLALRAKGVYALVEQASAFGSAGALVVVSFGLFTRVGGAITAATTLVIGTTSYVLSSIGGLPYPFLTSLAAALGTYLAGVGLELVVQHPFAPTAHR